jgi:ERCC4-related helicase
MKRLEHLFVVVSQEEAGILTQKKFRVIKTNNNITGLINELIKTKTLTIANNVIFADNNSREMQIVRQLCGGFVYKDDKSFIEISTIKIETLKELFKQYHKTLIYYYYQAEREMLLKYLKESVTENLDEAKTTGNHFIAQMTSMREGITFPECDAIIYYNVDFSAITFLQSQERASLQSKDAVDIVYLCSSDFQNKKLSFEEIVLNVLRKKKRFTDSIYGNIKNGMLHPYQLLGISG